MPDAYIDRIIALYRAIGDQFDVHPNFEFIKTGESTIGNDGKGYSDKGWAEQIIRRFAESKMSLQHTMIIQQMNFLGPGTALMESVAQAMSEVGGGDLVYQIRCRVEEPIYPRAMFARTQCQDMTLCENTKGYYQYPQPPKHMICGITNLRKSTIWLWIILELTTLFGKVIFTVVSMVATEVGGSKGSCCRHLARKEEE